MCLYVILSQLSLLNGENLSNGELLLPKTLVATSTQHRQNNTCKFALAPLAATRLRVWSSYPVVTSRGVLIYWQQK